MAYQIASHRRMWGFSRSRRHDERRNAPAAANVLAVNAVGFAEEVVAANICREKVLVDGCGNLGLTAKLLRCAIRGGRPVSGPEALDDETTTKGDYGGNKFRHAFVLERATGPMEARLEKGRRVAITSSIAAITIRSAFDWPLR